MDAWIAGIALVALLLVRIGVPVALMIGLVLVLHRLDRRWQRQAASEALAALDVSAPIASPAMAEAPCWEEKNCPAEKRERCPAPRNIALPCWLVRRDAEGCLPEQCFACALFNRTKPASPVAAVGDD